MDPSTSGQGDEEARTIYVRQLPMSTTEAKVKEIFGPYGLVVKVKLRRDEATKAFRGSAYVTFDSTAAANQACAGAPPAGLVVMSQAHYQRKRAAAGNAVTPHKTPYSDSKRARQDTGTAVTNSNGASAAYWQSTAEERERRIHELEESLANEKKNSASMLAKLTQAQQAADEANAREAAAARKVLAKDVELGGLKGEVATLRSAMHQKLDAVHQQYKARVHDLEVQLQVLKDQVSTLRQEKGRTEKGSAAAAAASKAASQNDPLLDL